MSNIDKQALREAAEKASTDSHTQDEWFHYLRCSTPETVLALLDELEAAEKQIAELKSGIKSANDRYENRTPTQWAYDQACLAIEKHRTRADDAEERIAELLSAVIAPGIMRCAGCGFVVTKNSINMNAGTITAGDSKTEPCPNGCGPLWPVTWKEQAIEMRDSSEQWFEELQEVRQRIAELERERVAMEAVTLAMRDDMRAAAAGKGE
ncbi:ead/Ea22-like family protein [Enterobacter genomosp. O]|uniref:ead/Ea22-like family protein n=1 Tax=Enterobacter genomosp. O TaxID=2364150 RepID=UPI0009EDB661|nr:ead/Ea22-like family protein [Enterobacter genomosp. O]